MARFALRKGEAILKRGAVECSVDGVARTAELILTDDRVVLVPDGDSRAPWMLGGAIGGLLAGLLSSAGARISHQISRDDLGVAEVRDKRGLWVRSKGEGYGMTHFEVKTSQAAAWAAQLNQWAATDAPAASVPGEKA